MAQESQPYWREGDDLLRRAAQQSEGEPPERQSYLSLLREARRMNWTWGHIQFVPFGEDAPGSGRLWNRTCARYPGFAGC